MQGPGGERPDQEQQDDAREGLPPGAVTQLSLGPSFQKLPGTDSEGCRWGQGKGVSIQAARVG